MFELIVDKYWTLTSRFITQETTFQESISHQKVECTTIMILVIISNIIVILWEYNYILVLKRSLFVYYNKEKEKPQSYGNKSNGLVLFNCCYFCNMIKI